MIHECSYDFYRQIMIDDFFLQSVTHIACDYEQELAVNDTHSVEYTPR